MDDAWETYPLGKVKELMRIAGFRVEIEGIDLKELLSSRVASEMLEEEEIKKIENLDEVSVDFLRAYISTLGARPDDSFFSGLAPVLHSQL